MTERARDLHIEKLEGALLDIVQGWEARSELYRGEADCAEGLANIARVAIQDVRFASIEGSIKNDRTNLS